MSPRNDPPHDRINDRIDGPISGPIGDPASPAPRPPERSVWLVAGGTGGHIYPALALGESLGRAYPEIEIEYCCGDRPNELEIYRSNGIRPRVYAISGRRRGIAGTICLAAQIARGWLRARGELRAALRNDGPEAGHEGQRGTQGRGKPVVVVGFGSYASVPVLLAARSLGIPTAIHEQNARPGRANRFLARGARLVFAGMEPAADAFGNVEVQVVGNPVRENLTRLYARGKSEDRSGRRAAREELGLPLEGTLGLVFGGSLGAAGLNHLVLAALDTLSGAAGRTEALRSALGDDSGEASGNRPGDAMTDVLENAALDRLHFLMAAGPSNFDEMTGELARRPALEGRLTLVPYIDRMDLAYGAADFAVCRAGALTLAELAVAGLPSILVPLPRSARGHQTENARAAEAAGAAVCIAENAPHATREMATALAQWAENSDKLSKMGNAAKALAKPSAGDNMAEALSLYIRA